MGNIRREMFDIENAYIDSDSLVFSATGIEIPFNTKANELPLQLGFKHPHLKLWLCYSDTIRGEMYHIVNRQECNTIEKFDCYDLPDDDLFICKEVVKEVIDRKTRKNLEGN